MFFPRDAIPFRTFSIVCALTALFAVSMGTRLGFRRNAEIGAPANPTSTAATIPETAQSKNDQPQAHALPILLRFAGFAPKEITKPAGDYFFAVGNLSGVKEVTFRLDRERGERLKEVNAKREKPWKQIVHLTPGTYLLTEANHPEWVCRITITSH